jgi:hypothetical protein
LESDFHIGPRRAEQLLGHLLDPESGYQFSAAQLEREILGRGLGAILMSNPSNPTGAVYTREELQALLDLARRRGLWIIADEIYCRFVYGEGEYLHDMTHGFYEAFQHSGGDEWRSTASFPPMLYPTHSVSMVLSVTGARLTTSWTRIGGIFRDVPANFAQLVKDYIAKFPPILDEIELIAQIAHGCGVENIRARVRPIKG